MTINNDSTISYNIKKFRLKLFPGRGGIGVCAKKIGIHHQQWRDWEKGKYEPGAEYQIKLAELFQVSIVELRGESNSNHNQRNVPVEDTCSEGITYSEKRDMPNTEYVESLKDHIATLKRENEELRQEKAELKAEVVSLREENKRLLTLSSGKDTTQAGSG